MAHSTPTPAASNTDWYTLLLSAFINGLKAYGASFMMGAPGPSHLGTGDSSTEGSKPATNPRFVVASKALCPIHRALCPIHRAVSSRDGWETMNSHPDAGFPMAPRSPAGSRA
jgi:hypothetical protein